MLPLRDVQLLCIGGAAVIDTALLLVLFERRNWRRVALPVVLLIVGAWCYHTGAFVHTLILETPGAISSFVHWLAMFTIAMGLLLMPSAMLHAVIRLRDAELTASPSRQPRYALFYVPLLALVPIGLMLAEDARGTFLALVAPLVAPYIAWLSLVNVIAAIGFHRLRHKVDLPRAPTFFSLLSVGLLVLTALHLFALAIAIPTWPDTEAYWQLAMVMSPVLLIVLLAYFILRFNFMQLVLERTIVYGVIVIGIVIGHRFLFRQFLTQWDERYQFDFAFVEAAILVVFALAYPPLRQRTSEGLRYLMGERVTAQRDNSRRMALQMAALTGQPPLQLVSWFDDSVRRAFDVEFVAIWLFDSQARITCEYAGRADSALGRSVPLGAEDAHRLRARLSEQGLAACRRHDAPTGCIETLMHKAGAQLAVPLDHPNLSGLVLLGPRARNRTLSDEQVSMIVMLVEQLGITVHSSLLQAERIAAERRALQNEKLSTLGLIAGSIAHEVKNPLSSIKTIASVLAEELAGSPQEEDLRLILGEIDRLSSTVSQLLQFARPRDDSPGSGSLLSAVSGTLRIMRHVAKERSVTIREELPTTLPAVKAGDSVLREIVFNLIGNAIDAAGPGGQIDVRLSEVGSTVELQIADNGPGLPTDVHDRLFEPFVTTKENGTGLGLYVVGRHVREASGEIHCQTEPGKGTRFIVRLPAIA